MSKTNDELIRDYKKANSERKEKLAIKAGFKTGEEYLNSLQGKKVTVKVSKKEVMDYVVAFDTTGSMGAYIGNVKKHVEKLIPEMFSQEIDLNMRIVAFGDYCDMRDGKFGNAYQESEFTDNVNELIKFVQNAKDTGGGDANEFYELVIKKITEETPWRPGSKRVVLFIGDADPHRPGYRYANNTYQIDWKVEANKAAKLGISFDTLAIHGNAWYKELSQLTNGVYLPFKSSEKMAQVVTASAYARGSVKSKSTFTASYMAAEASGDAELIGTYKSLSTLL